MWKQRPPKGYAEAIRQFYGGDEVRKSRFPAAQGKCDSNQSQIIRLYEELYCSVIDLHILGHGISDLLVGCGKVANDLVEVKTQDGEESEAQALFRQDWRGRPPRIVRTQADVIAHVHELIDRALL